MDAFLTSTTAVTLAEIGDKTQLLTLLLVSRFRNPVALILGILTATLLNHGLSAWMGQFIGSFMSRDTGNLILGISFILMGAWLLIPDKPENVPGRFDHLGAFWVTTILFFLAEIGDKTQVATVLLAAEYQSVLWVTAGTTLGMLLANLPVIYLGQKLLDITPVRAIQMVASGLFITLGVVTLW
ncbi:TMEM165/GDT1 family protein [Alteromonas antoniana]|uniref:TMEM165/GDT1 family protein n=1 Tax=Alteromonas antoniana TaxID=2803813 RepID=UPI001C48F1F8|nr:TMEM165/GDT1 family protein [Alteromonas antoniana]